jgi:hypothetical protein
MALPPSLGKEHPVDEPRVLIRPLGQPPPYLQSYLLSAGVNIPRGFCPTNLEKKVRPRSTTRVDRSCHFCAVATRVLPPMGESTMDGGSIKALPSYRDLRAFQALSVRRKLQHGLFGFGIISSVFGRARESGLAARHQTCCTLYARKQSV